MSNTQGNNQGRVETIREIFMEAKEIFKGAERAGEWLNKPNGFFGGKLPYDALLDGPEGEEKLRQVLKQIRKDFRI